MPTAFCLLAEDLENSPEDKVLLIEYWNASVFQIPVSSIIPTYLSLAE